MAFFLSFYESSWTNMVQDANKLPCTSDSEGDPADLRGERRTKRLKQTNVRMPNTLENLNWSVVCTMSLWTECEWAGSHVFSINNKDNKAGLKCAQQIQVSNARYWQTDYNTAFSSLGFPVTSVYSGYTQFGWQVCVPEYLSRAVMSAGIWLTAW